MSKIKQLDTLKIRSIDCTNCDLCRTRTNVVFGEGSINADLMFIGEGPGYNEDMEARPFVGRSGKKLDQWIESIGLTRQDVYIANVVKCRPPDNRDPKPEEVKACKDYLMKQIEIVSPKIICTLGRPATHTLLEVNDPIRRLINRELKFHNTIVIPLYHPAFVLRNCHKQNDVNIGLRLVKEKLE